MVFHKSSQNTTKCKCRVTCMYGMGRGLLLVCETYFHCWYRQVPSFTKPKLTKTDRRRGVGENARKRVKCMMVTEVGSEVDVGMIQTKEANKGGTFKDKFKHSGKTTQTPTQVWTDKYRLLLKSNGWGGAGEKSGLKTGVRGKQLPWN